jgi:pimeloyl-ACP methyl ester carboxylesterase
MILESFDGTNINYRVKRKSELFLVFVHGWLHNWTAWKKEIEFLEGKGYSTLAFDLRGHGQSDKPEKKKQYDLECFAKDLHELIKKEKIKKFVLIGHSMGGMISLIYYKMFRRGIQGLVLCDTTYRNVLKHKEMEVFSPFIKHVLDFLVSHESITQEHFKHLKDIDLTKYSEYGLMHNSLRATPMKSVFACLEEMTKYNVKSILKKINVPVLIMEGEEDRILPEIDSLEMCKKIKGSKLTLIPGGGHFVNLQNPRQVDKHILEFLKKNKLGTRK